MPKKASLILCLLIFVSITISVSGQTLSQMGFVLKKGMPDIENIAVLCGAEKKEAIAKEAKTAFLVTKKWF